MSVNKKIVKEGIVTEKDVSLFICFDGMMFDLKVKILFFNLFRNEQGLFLLLKEM